MVLVLSACDSETDPPETDAALMDGGGVDSGSRDAGTFDGAARDGEAPRDAGPDAAAPLDASPVDAADVDGGPVSMPCTAMGSCDPFVPTSCPSGQKCAVTDTGTECRALTMTPPLGSNAACVRDEDCGPTLWCVSFDAAGFTCRPMCPAGSVGFCGPDAACTGSVGTETCVRACRELPARCNIYTQDCADAADMCTLTTHPETLENYTGCRLNGTLTVDMACGGSLGRCERGLICIREAGVSTCRQVCGPAGGPPACAAGACTGLSRSWGVPYCR